MIVLETSRLIVRRFAPEDLPALAKIHADPDVMRFIGGVRTVEQVRARLADFFEAYDRVGFSKWAVVLRSSGELIGRCGPSIESIDGIDEVEVGYTFAKDVWGKGFATEAAEAAVRYCFDVLGRTRVIALIDPANEPSQRVARRLGMTDERAVQWRNMTVRLYARSHQR
jgi:[ribosomal protein S5]-alanine N-acetyltransferase